eukprot:1159640-Pelagomonas_calceolata.AAC.5
MMPCSRMTPGPAWWCRSMTGAFWLVKLTRRPPKPKDTPHGRFIQLGALPKGCASPAVVWGGADDVDS